MSVFSDAAVRAFTAAGAVTETYTAPGGTPTSVSVLFERGIRAEVPGRESLVIDRRLRAHLLVSEVGRPPRGATLTDGGSTRTVDAVEADDGDVVVCVVN